MRLSLMGALLAALIYAASAVAASPGMHLFGPRTGSQVGCVRGLTGYSYSGFDTYPGQSGFVSGSPGSPITKSVVIEPMVMDMTDTNGHSTAYWGVGSDAANGDKYWLQVGVTIGLSPANGWNQTATQYFNVPTLYVEWAWDYYGVNQSYYFQAIGPSSGLYHYDYFGIRQETSGNFSALVNGSSYFTGAVPVNGGRRLGGQGEDLSRADTLCENQDFYFEMVGPDTFGNPNMSYWTPLDLCSGRGNSNYYYSWESFNKNYGGMRHGIPLGIVTCAF